jgi:tetratricopeptide (TPR) repeat protein
MNLCEKKRTTKHRLRFLFLLFFLLLLGGKLLMEAEADSSAEYTKANTLLREHQYLKALELLENILTRDPSFLAAYRALFECYSGLGDSRGASIFIESLYLENPKNAAVNYGMGYSLFQQKKFTAAAGYFDRAIQLGPDLAEAWNNRAAIFQFVEKDNDHARQYYKKAIEIAARTGNQRVLEIAKKNLAHVPKKRVLNPVTEKLTLEAFINRLMEAIDANDETRVSELILGQKLNSERAVEWLIEEAIRDGALGQKEKEQATIRLARLIANLYRENFSSNLLNEKLESYQNLPAQQKQLFLEGETHLENGVRFEDTSQYSQAIESYQNALECFTKIGDVHRSRIAFVYLGDAYYKTKEYGAACRAYQSALERIQGSAEYKSKAHLLSSAGSACFHAQEYGLALNFLNRAMALYREMNDEDSMKIVEHNIQLVKNKLE